MAIDLKYVLVGPNAGKSGTWGGKVFREGVYVHTPPQQPMEIRKHAALLDRALGAYGAFREDTSACERAVAAWNALQAGLPPPPPPPAEPEKESEEAPGSEDPGEVFENQKLINAIRSIDPENDQFWTNSGKPYIGQVEAAYGQGGLNRKRVEEALPGWDRDQARAYCEELAARKQEAQNAASQTTQQ